MFSFGKPSKRKFAAQFRATLKRLDSTAYYEYDAATFRLVRKDKEGEVNLANLYQEHCSLSRDERKAHLVRLAHAFLGGNDLPEDFEEVKPHLRPKIWNRSTFAMMELERQIEKGRDFDIPLYPLGSHLYSSLVLDTEHAMRSISNEQLEEWGVSYYEAMEIACRNLDETTTAFAQIGPHFHSSVTGDNYDSGRVLLLDRIKSFEVEGDHIAVVPQRDAMYVADSADETSLKILFDLTAKTIAEEARPLCPLPMRLEDDEWVDWTPPKNHLLRKQFDDLELQYLGGLYTDQKQLIDLIFERDEVPTVVATFSAIKQEETDNLWSYCVWSEGLDTLLPRTQFVVLTSEERPIAGGTWDAVAGVVGDLMVADEDYYPLRYRAREFPSAVQLAQIGMDVPFVR